MLSELIGLGRILAGGPHAALPYYEWEGAENMQNALCRGSGKADSGAFANA
jgi:hypothetical protein